MNMRLSWPAPPLSRYLRVNHPYVWRTRVHFYLPLFCLTGILCYWSSYDQTSTLKQIPYNHFDKISELIFSLRFYLAIIGILWFIQLWRKPLQNAGTNRLTLTFVLYFLCIFVADIGPKIFGHNEIMAISRIPQATATSSANLLKDRAIFLKLCSYDEAIKHKQEVTAALTKYGYSPEFVKRYYPSDVEACRSAGYEKNEEGSDLKDGYFGDILNKLDQLLETKKYAENQYSSLQHFRPTNLQPVLFYLVIAFILLIASTERELTKLKSYLSPLIKLIKIPLHLDITGTVGDHLSRNRPTWWAFGLHVALARLGLATAIVVCLYYVLNNVEFSDDSLIKATAYILVFCILYFYWIYHQYYSPRFYASFKKNIVLIFLMVLMQFPAFFILTGITTKDFDNLVDGIVIASCFIPWIITILLAATLRNLIALIIAFLNLPISFLVFVVFPSKSELNYFAFGIPTVFFIAIVTMTKNPSIFRYSLLYFLAFLFPYVLFYFSIEYEIFNHRILSSTIMGIGLIVVLTLLVYALLITKIQKTTAYPSNIK